MPNKYIQTTHKLVNLDNVTHIEWETHNKCITILFYFSSGEYDSDAELRTNISVKSKVDPSFSEKVFRGISNAILSDQPVLYVNDFTEHIQRSIDAKI